MRMFRNLALIGIVVLLTACAQTPVDKARNTLMMKAQADQYYTKRDCANAIPVYQEVIRDMPGYVEGWLRIGNCHVSLNDLDAALASYRRAVQIDPSYVKGWYNLSRVQARMLGNTVTEMYRNVDETDPMAVEVRRFTIEVLEAFELPAELKQETSRVGQVDDSSDAAYGMMDDSVSDAMPQPSPN